jgi:integrase
MDGRGQVRQQRRRPKGEGSIVHRSDGRWAYVVDLGTDTSGKRTRRTIYAATRPALLRRVQDERARQGGSLQKLEVSEYLESWLTKTIEPNRAAATYSLYDGMLRKHVLPILGRTKLERIDPDAVDRLYERMRANGATPSVMNSCARILRAAFEARTRRTRAANPFHIVEMPRYRAPEAEALRVDVARSFLKAAKSSPIESLFVIALCAGVRPQGLLAIKWSDIDDTKRVLDIKRQLRDDKGHVSIVPTKTPRSRRTIPLNELAIDALKRRRGIAGKEGHGSEYVHTGPTGAFLRPSHVRRIYLKPILVAAGIEHATVRQLRKSFSTLLANDGVNPGTNSDLMGHSKRSTAIDHYQQGDATLNRDAVDRLNDVLVGRNSRARRVSEKRQSRK